ncbi:hypothetical protein CPB97_002421 [Podila verticillata]|nr:hypothetical protein CPB97_002421 [Podila verticillata]
MDLSNTTDVKIHIKTTTTIDLHPLISHVNTNVLSWHCSLHKVGLKTSIELWPKGDSAVRRNFYRDIRSLRIFNNRGELVAGTAVNNHPVNERTYTVLVETESIQVEDHLELDAVLSNDELVNPLPQRVIGTSTAEILKVLASLMKDIATQDFAFTFGLNGSARNIGLWAHQSVLAHQPVLAALIRKLKAVEGSSSDSDLAAGIKSHHITDYSLESYCCLIRFLYCGVIELNVDLGDFAIGSPPNKPFSPSCGNRPKVDRNFASGSSFSSSTDPNRVATYSEVFQVADCYQVTKLRQFCMDKIKETLSVSTALDVLYGFAYRYPDLKSFVLEFVAKRMNDLYASNPDPFASYASHPKWQDLQSEALRLTFKAKAQARKT